MASAKSTSSLFFPWGKRRTMLSAIGPPSTKDLERAKSGHPHSQSKANFKIQSQQPQKLAIKNAVWGNVLQAGDINFKRANYRKLHVQSQTALRREKHKLQTSATFYAPKPTPELVLGELEALLSKNPIRQVKSP